MASATAKVPKLDECNCLAVRQGAAHHTILRSFSA
jgi:hypothetical protein